MYELKTNTAVRISVGPLVDPTDGKTAEVLLDVTALLVQLYRIKTDGSAVVRTAITPTASGGNNDMVLVASSTDGMYDLELTADQLNWLGNGRISLYDIDGFLVHYFDIHVISANYFNNKYGSTIEEVNVTKVNGTSQTANDNGADINTIVAKLPTNYIMGSSVLTDKDDEIDAIKAKTDNLPSGVAKNVALANFPFFMTDNTDHVSGKASLTVTATISKDGGAFATCTNSVSEIANGVYKISLTQTEMNADTIILKFTGTNADQRTVVITTS